MRASATLGLAAPPMDASDGSDPLMALVPDPRTFFERFGAFGESREEGQMFWAVGLMVLALWQGQHDHAADIASLLLVALEQASIDRGRRDLAWILILLEESHPTPLDRRHPKHSIRPFPKLADQLWVTASLSYLREMDVIQTRRKELTGSGPPRGPPPPPKATQGDPATGAETPAREPKKRGGKGKDGKDGKEGGKPPPK